MGFWGNDDLFRLDGAEGDAGRKQAKKDANAPDGKREAAVDKVREAATDNVSEAATDDVSDAEYAELDDEMKALVDLERAERAERAGDEAAKGGKQTDEQHQRPRDATKTPQPAAKGTKGDVWSFDLHHTGLVVVGYLLLAGATAGAAYCAKTEGIGTGAIVLAVFAVPCLMLCTRAGIILDKRNGTVTKWQRFLFVPRRRTRTIAGNKLVLERRLHMPKDRDSYWAGHVFVGDLDLFAKRESEATQLVKEIGRFFDVRYYKRNQSAKDINKRAVLPLILTFSLSAVFVVVFVIIEYFRSH